MTGSGSSTGSGTMTGGTTTNEDSTATPPSSVFCASPILIAKHSGSGPSAFNGGWVGATCDQDINPTGCVTFHFKTDGDFRKGTGWDASFTCLNPVSYTHLTLPTICSV